MLHQGQRIAILGAGTSGIAAARLAVASGAEWVGVFDSGDVVKLNPTAEMLGSAGIECCFGAAAVEAPTDLDLVVLSPGIDATWPIAEAFAATGAPLIGEIEFAYRHCDCPVVAITGTNGKTTTTELTAAVLEAGNLRTVAAGNYGKAFSEVILSGQRYDVITLEISSFQLETIETFRPKVSVWMNFAPDHLDRYASLDDYRAAKLRIFENQTAEDFSVINAAEPPCELLAKTVTFSGFGTPADFDFCDGWIRFQGAALLDFSTVRLVGKHNAENVMAALAIAHCLGIDPALVLGTVRTYAPPHHRCEPVGEINGHCFINDSKATNLHALASSLRGQESPVVLIAGGKNKGLDYAEMREFLPGAVSHVVCIGEIAGQITDLWGDLLPCEKATNLEEAVRLALAAANPGQTVLFSPGTSSFDMFSGYAERGDAFRDAVQQVAS
ncbi:MAG: UDP-N-acetylmuramoyl-L-alanine--D-glutamate ligase [Verrucomicrobiae bacterium]|nr:UDP-N-acetylmuramoyl-L-alanine--D-glutamate ligase [Verrucomicrobiae bacterium]